MTPKRATFLIIFTSLLVTVKGHGRLMKPPSRSSIWRIAEFSSLKPPPNYTDNQLFCGGLHQAKHPGDNCGLCGDPISQSNPRDNQIGGLYYRGIITGKYTSGQTIGVEVEITAAHYGFMEWRLCTNASIEIQKCFDQNLLTRADGRGSRLNVTTTGTYKTQLKLPQGVKCSHCSIQWNYRSGNNWGQCDDGSTGLGCGPQEVFRGCADVSIQ